MELLIEPLIKPFLVIGVTLILVFGIGFVLNRVYYRDAVRRLRGLAECLDDAVLAVDESPFLRGLAETSMDAKLDGRPLRLTFEFRGQGKSSTTWLLLRLDVTNPVGGFEISHAGLLRRVGRFLGLVKDVATGDQGVDDKYILSGQEGNLKQLFRDPELGRAVDEVFQAGFSGVRLEKDELFAERRIARLPEPSELHANICSLARLASFCERRALQVQLLGPRQRFALVGGSGHARCPYCHDDLNVSGAVAACDRCDTLHHQACFAEARGCTVLGCGSQRTARSPA